MKRILLLALAFSATPALAANTLLTTHTNTTTTTTTRDASGNVTGSNTVSTDATTTSDRPAATHHAGSRAADATAGQFPYNPNNPDNRSDVDTARRGFDDPRDPWDGRYSNDNPDNYSASGNTDPSRHTATPGTLPNAAPGAYGTHAVHTH